MAIEAVELYTIQDDELIGEDSRLDVEALSDALNGNGEFVLKLPEGPLVERDKGAHVFVVFHYTL